MKSTETYRTLTLRMTASELEKLDAYCDREGLSRAPALRQLVLTNPAFSPSPKGEEGG